MFTDTTEKSLETLIVEWLCDRNGYEQGENADYDRDHAIDVTRLFRFLNATQPEEMAKLQLDSSEIKRKQFLDRLQGEIAKRGIIDVLRKGISVYPANLILFYMTPSPKNYKAAELFKQNIFSVTRQLMYSNDNTKLALDLCIFINGLPVITCELKNLLTKQNVQDAVEQYQLDLAQRMREIRKGGAISLHVKRCTDYIYDHLHENITLADLAQREKLNPSYLSKLFSKELGMGVKDYIIKAKIETAKNILRYSDFSILDISISLGYSSQSAFTAAFRQATGLTPKKYRDKYFTNNEFIEVDKNG